jgi:NAD(P)-dependent dehydrogenase (short-subunit alcohol dehydrogenase family)
MTIADKAILVTGANRGIGQALVEEGLRRGVRRVYAGTRQPLTHTDARVTSLTLDVTNAAQIQAAVESVESLDLLINNAGVAPYDDLSDRAALEQSLASSTTPTPRTSAGSTLCGACTSGSTARRSVATRPASGGAATTSTTAGDGCE